MESMYDFDAVNNGTSNGTVPLYLGFIGCAVSATFYGTNFIPVKKFETGDGMFFQWVLCNAILIVGLVIQMIRTSRFYPIVMLGGAIWATGNVCVVPIIKTIGLGLGLCIWGSMNLFIGWAFGRFGAFGIHAEIPNDVKMNYAGVALAVFSSVIFSFVKPEVALSQLEMTVEVKTEDEPLLKPDDDNIQSRVHGGSLYGSTSEDILVFNKKRRGSGLSKSNEDSGREPGMPDQTFLDRLSPPMKKVVGIVLSVISGCLYGAQFTPAIFVQDNVPGASNNSLDYVFAHFCGIYLTSTFYFIVYIIYCRNKPFIYPKVILPGFISGAMWGVATAAWFIANKALSEPVSFPIITTVPGGIALTLGILVFREIKGRRNIVIALFGIAFTVAGSTLAGLSKR